MHVRLLCHALLLYLRIPVSHFWNEQLTGQFVLEVRWLFVSNNGETKDLTAPTATWKR
jgi:hypothetical protein